uniref:phosphoinositide-3-kinase-interacting protein 1 n=1 Tax=Myxine glutinosa TaxID=7769 RepID=UPI00358F31F7
MKAWPLVLLALLLVVSVHRSCAAVLDREPDLKGATTQSTIDSPSINLTRGTTMQPRPEPDVQAQTVLSSEKPSSPGPSSKSQTRGLIPLPPRRGKRRRKDLGLPGQVMGFIMMGIIISAGVGISLAYLHKKWKRLQKEQHLKKRESELKRLQGVGIYENPACDETRGPGNLPGQFPDLKLQFPEGEIPLVSHDVSC